MCSSQTVATPFDYDCDDSSRERLTVSANAEASTMPKSEDPYRPVFARDYDRLVHSRSFRRLQGKAQVVTTGQADFFRTRITHTVEVAQIARRLSYRLGTQAGLELSRLNDLCDISEASAIAHDFGHPPFGHTGEEGLNDAVDATADRWGLDKVEVGGFEGNAQTFRMLTWSLARAEIRDGAPTRLRGLQLTRAVLDAVIKYPKTRQSLEDRKWNYYPSESSAFNWTRENLPSEYKEQSLEAQIMDWSDDVAYATHDVEDWGMAGLMPLVLLSQSGAAREWLSQKVIERMTASEKIYSASDEQASKANVKNLPTEDEMAGVVKSLFEDADGFGGLRTLGTEYDSSAKATAAMARMRGQLFNMALEGINIVPRDGADAGFPARHRYNLSLNDSTKNRAIKNRVAVLKEMLWIYVLHDPKLATQRMGQRQVVKDIYGIYADVVKNDDKLGKDTFPADIIDDLSELKRAVAEGDKNPFATSNDGVRALRMIADHVSSMTDEYAASIHNRLTGSNLGIFNEFV